MTKYTTLPIFVDHPHGLRLSKSSSLRYAKGAASGLDSLVGSAFSTLVHYSRLPRARRVWQVKDLTHLLKHCLLDILPCTIEQSQTPICNYRWYKTFYLFWRFFHILIIYIFLLWL